jgi:hypothetical protein
MTVVAPALVACAPRGVKQHYARSSGCAEDEIRVENKGSAVGGELSRYEAQGCGGTTEYVCRKQECKATFSVVAYRQARQFNCGVDAVQVKDLGGGAWQAVGCDQTLTYQCGADAQLIVRCIAETTEQGGGQVSR